MNQQQAVEQLLRHGSGFKQSGLSAKRMTTVAHQAIIYSYYTAIAKVDYSREVVLINTRKYSQTTSRHQNLIQREAIRKGFKVEYISTNDPNDFLKWTRL